METIDEIVRKVAAEMLNTSMQDITAERIHGWATRLGDAAGKQLVTDCNQHETVDLDSRCIYGDAKGAEPVGNAAKIREALKYLRDASREFHHLILNSKYNEVCDKYKYTEVAKIRDAIANANIALSAPPRYCDVMSLELAKKLWFTKEIMPRLTGDLPLGKEIPFEEWFVSQLEQEAKGE